jgi:hypothetical protein
MIYSMCSNTPPGDRPSLLTQVFGTLTAIEPGGKTIQRRPIGENLPGRLKKSIGSSLPPLPGSMSATVRVSFWVSNVVL